MAVSNYALFIYNNGRQVVDSKGLEVLVKSISVSADAGVTNTLTIKEGTAALANMFDFGGKVLANLGAPSANGHALRFDMLGANSGIAQLDSGGKIPSGQLPSSVMQYQATFNPATHLPNLQNTGAAIKAVKVIQGLTYTAKAAGAAGNLTSVTYVNGGASQSLTVGVVDNAITVNLATDGDSIATSTADAVKTAVKGYGAAAALVDLTGSGAVALVAAAQAYLVGGADAANAGDFYKATAAGSHDFGAGALAFVVGDYAVYNNLGVWELAHSGADAVISVDGQTSVVNLSAVYAALGHNHTGVYDPAGTAAGKIAASIAENDTTHAPDGASVFTALAGKSGTGHTHTGVYDPAGTAAGIIASAITNGDTTHAPSGDVVFDALALKADASAIGSGEFKSLTNKEVGAITVRQFVKMLVNGQVTLLAAADSVNEETFFGCVKTASIAADAPGDIYLPEVGARVTGFTSLDVTKLLYATTAGGFTQTRPVTGKVIILGRPVSDTEIVFIGKLDYVYG